jgi:hypothetical protein
MTAQRPHVVVAAMDEARLAPAHEGQTQHVEPGRIDHTAFVAQCPGRIEHRQLQP